jgi:hypothetical protein
LFGILVAIGAYLIVDIIAIAMYDDTCGNGRNSNNPTTCYNIDMKPINYVMFWFGVVLIIMLLLFLIIMPCYALNILQDFQRYREDKERRARLQNTESSFGSAASINEDEFIKHGSLYKQNNLSEHECNTRCELASQLQAAV